MLQNYSDEDLKFIFFFILFKFTKYFLFFKGQTSDSSTNETGIIKDVLNQSSAPSTSFKDSVSNVLQKESSTSDEALTAIVISQRERFRIRNIELENVIE